MLQWDFSGLINFPEVIRNSIKDTFSKIKEMTFFENSESEFIIKSDLNEIAIIISNVSYKDVHFDKIASVYQTISSIFENAEPAIRRVNAFAIINEVPTHPISAPEIQFIAGKGTSLSGLHNMIRCHKLNLCNTHKISSSVLTLFYLKNLEGRPTVRISFKSIATKRPEWSNIVGKYISTNDVLACQEALMEAGYKQHATL